MRIVAPVALAACWIALCACTSMAHTRVPTRMIVVDALTGQPAPDISINQVSRTGYISTPIVSDATTGPDGDALFDVIYAHRRSSYWRLTLAKGSTAAKPTPRATHSWQSGNPIPLEFKKLADGGYRIPLWPSTELIVELPSDFVGLVIVAPRPEDCPESCGWMPPTIVDGVSKRTAIAKPDEHGVVSYPTSIAGFRGFGFDEIHLQRWNDQSKSVERLESVAAYTRIPSVGKRGASTASADHEYSGVYAWGISDYDESARWESTEADWAPWNHRKAIWFVGTLADLRQWVARNQLSFTEHFSYMAELREPVSIRVYDSSQLNPILPADPLPTTVPVWVVGDRGTSGGTGALAP